MIKRIVNQKQIDQNKELRNQLSKLEKLIKVLLDKKIIDKTDLEGIN